MQAVLWKSDGEPVARREAIVALEYSSRPMTLHRAEDVGLRPNLLDEIHN